MGRDTKLMAKTDYEFTRFDCPLCLEPCHDSQGFINHIALYHKGVITDRLASFNRFEDSRAGAKVI